MSYTKGQLVWAKIKGYPWWPAVVQIVSKPNQDKNSLQEKEVLVNFIGENSHAVLTYDKVADFNAKFKTHSSSKNKKLQDSIKVAQRIISGESTYEEEREKLIATLQAEAAEVKQTTRGRPSTKKKMELGIENPLPPRDKDATTKPKEVASKSKDAAQKEKDAAQKDKAALYKFKEDVLGLKKSDSPQKEKSAVSKEKEPVHREKESPKSKKQTKDSRLTQKQKTKEKEKEKKRESEEYQDYVPFRLTRSQVRRDVEPPVELEVKNKKRGAKGDSTKAKKEAAEKNAKDTKENAVKSGKGKGRLLLDDDDSLDGYHIKKQGESKMDEENIPSPAKVSERKFSGGKLDFEEEKTPQAQAQMNAETSVSRASEGRMEVEIHTEPAIGSLKSLEANNTSTAESLASNATLNNKRTNSAILKDASPIYATQVKDKESKPMLGEAEYNEYITKKMKLADNPPTETDKVLDERALGIEVYNMLLIKKFEDNLSRILDKLSNKLQGNDRLKEYDVDMIKILEIIEEFESRSFNGSEFIGSDLGKILKTIHFLLVKNKTRLPKTGDLVITALAKILHKIKDGIIKYCLDNTEYMDALRLPQESAKPTHMAAIDIDFEEIKAKIEEMGAETKVEAVPIATKIEEESTSAYSNVQKTAVQTTEATNPKPQPVQQQPVTTTAAPVVTQPVTTTPTVVTATKEPHKDTVKGSPVIKPAESNPNEITLLLRKKICQKLARLLQRSYHMDKDKSQELTLRIEDKLNKFYLGNANEYKQAIKGLHKLIKVQVLSQDDLAHVMDMTLDKFKQMLKEKLPEIADTHGNADNDHDLTPQNDPADLVRREPPLMNEDSSTFDFQAYLASKIDNDPTLSSLAKKENEELKQKMIVEEPNTLTQDAFNNTQEENKHCEFVV